MTNVRPDDPSLPATVPARMVNQFVYCARLFHLEWVQAEFTTSDDVEQGLYVHRVLDNESGDLPDKQDARAGRKATSVWLSSSDLGLSARLDVVEASSNGEVVPVDFKKGRPAPDGGAWAGDRIQSLIQALLLRKAGYEVDRAEIWYNEVRRRVTFPVDAAAVAETREVLRELWEVPRAERPPVPLVNSPKCPRCSLVGICLPGETHALTLRASERTKPRKIMAPNPDNRPVYVTAQGAAVGVRGGRLDIVKDGARISSFRLIDVSQLCLFGNVTVSPHALRELMARESPVLWFSYGGWFCGMADGLPSKNVEVRRAQYTAPPMAALEIARWMIAGRSATAEHCCDATSEVMPRGLSSSSRA